MLFLKQILIFSLTLENGPKIILKVKQLPYFLDMFLWQVGFELDLLDNLRQGKNEDKSIKIANKLGITNSAIPSVVMNDIDNRWK